MTEPGMTAARTPRSRLRITLFQLALVLVALGAVAPASLVTVRAAVDPSATREAAAQKADDDKAWVPGQPQFGVTASSARGEAVYKQTCAACHDARVPRAPDPYILRVMPPSAIYRALTTGAMRAQGQALADEDRRAVAEYLSGRPFGAASQLEPPACAGDAAKFDYDEPPIYPAWGMDAVNTRYVPTQQARIDASNIGLLRLKWALGFDGATKARSQPALAGGALYVGSDDGRVFALDRETGCERWSFQAGAEVRTAIVVETWKQGDTVRRPLLYFGDLAGSIYAVNAVDGSLAWRDRADPHSSTTLTAAPALSNGRLYVPVSSLEEGTADGKYPCCTFRGSIVAFDAASGRRLWQTYLVDAAKLQKTTDEGVQHWGPSGIAVWNTPAIDERRGVLYFTTGDNYSSPTTELSDAIIAMDLATGRIRWVYQATANDAWNGTCSLPDKKHCPAEDGPDFDFGAAAILATARDGRQYVLAGQKSGAVYALDPDRGKLVWTNRVGRGGILAGVYFGMAAHDDRVYVPINDAPDGRSYPQPAKPGLYALDLHTGKTLWSAPASESSCAGRGAECAPGLAAPVTVTDDLVFAGAGDGWLRAYDARTGKVLWQHDTMREFPTVGEGTAKGGSMGGGAGPIVHNGLLIMPSGYGFAGRMPGNVLLVLGVDQPSSSGHASQPP
jgi:polyvinyl alcohol dehydrogenase (cytochrome)